MEKYIKILEERARLSVNWILHDLRADGSLPVDDLGCYYKPIFPLRSAGYTAEASTLLRHTMRMFYREDGDLRDADGRTVRTVEEPCEILSLTGTVSRQRCHLHIALSRQGLTAFGGHLMPGCMVNTTCELILGELPGWRFGTEQDSETGYDEIVFTEETP